MINSSWVSPRTGVVSRDSHVASLIVYPCQGSGVVRLGATSNNASCTLTCRVILWDSAGAFVAATQPVTFTSDASLDDYFYVGTPSVDAWFPTGGAWSYSVQVTSVSSGSWTLTQMAF